MTKAKKIKDNGKTAFVYMFSFVIPIIIAALAFFQSNVYPGGSNLIITYDLRGQILPFYSYLSSISKGLLGFTYTFSGGLGGGFTGNIAYYYSPLDIFYVFVPVKCLPDAVYFITLFRIGLCGLSMSAYLRYNKVTNLTGRWNVALSCCYALMSYNIAFSSIPMWFGAVILLPVLALCFEIILLNGRKAIFIVVMTLCLIINFYMAYMVGVALLFYCLFRVVEERCSIRHSLRIVLRYIFHCLLSLLMSMFVVLPAILELREGKLSGQAATSSEAFLKNGVFEIIGQLFPMKFSSFIANQPPYIYCCSIAIIFALLWLLLSEDWRTKIAGIVIFIIYGCSFALGPIDRIWHGFNDPLGFSCRYSFTFVFFIIIFASRGISCVKPKVENISIANRSLLSGAIIFYIFIELVLNSSYIVSKVAEEYEYANRAEYMRMCNVICDQLSIIDDNSFYRLAKNYNYTNMDGALYGYNGIDYFSSDYNVLLISFLEKLGLNSYSNFISEKGLTPPTASLFGVKYYLSYFKDYSNIYEAVENADIYKLYCNEQCLPLAIGIKGDGKLTLAELGDNPFENINSVYKDILGDASSDIFLDQQYNISIEKNDMEQTESGLVNLGSNSIKVSFRPEKDGYYFFYRKYAFAESDYHDDGVLPADLIYLYYYLNDMALGDYGFLYFRYASYLGDLNEGDDYVLTMDAGSSFDGGIYLSYIDTEAYFDALDSVQRYELADYNDNTIVLNGISDSDGAVLMSIPFEDGLSAKVNGEVVEIEPYMDCLVKIPVKKGNNEIIIKYFPPGLAAGILVSIFTLVFLLLHFVLICRKRSHIINNI